MLAQYNYVIAKLMPIHPKVLLALRMAKKNVIPFLYLLVPITIYLVLLIIYPLFQRLVMGRESVDCSQKTMLILIDEYLFSWVYDFVRESSNVVSLAICAFVYILHFGSPGVYVLYMMAIRPGWYYFWLFGLSLGLASSISIILQYSLPAPPPWLFNELPPEAKFFHVDSLLPIPIFHNIYGLNKLVCGAFPSIHVEWPAIIALNGAVPPVAGVIYVLWIVWAAIYSGHHWVSDVLGGLLIALISDFLAKLYVKTLTFEVVELEVEAI